MVRIDLTEDALKAGLKLSDKLKGRYVAIQDALAAIDLVENKQKRQKLTVLFDAKGSGSNQDYETQQYYSTYS